MEDIFTSDLDMIRDAVCAGAEVYASYRKKQESNGMQIKSESTDGYSVTYVNEQTDGQTLEELMQKKAYEAVKNVFIANRMAVERSEVLQW